MATSAGRLNVKERTTDELKMATEGESPMGMTEEGTAIRTGMTTRTNTTNDQKGKRFKSSIFLFELGFERTLFPSRYGGPIFCKTIEIKQSVCRTLQSTVVMPAIETKSRDEKIMELAKTEKKEVVNRNKRMFAGLMSALTGGGGRKDDVKKEERAKKMNEKLSEVEHKLEEQKLQEKEKVCSFFKQGLFFIYCSSHLLFFRQKKSDDPRS